VGSVEKAKGAQVDASFERKMHDDRSSPPGNIRFTEFTNVIQA
jgi:hypothetical protein